MPASKSIRLRVAGLDADEHAGGDDEERDAGDGVHGGHVLEDLGHTLRRVAGPRQATPRCHSRSSTASGGGAHGPGLGVLGAGERFEVPLGDLRHA